MANSDAIERLVAVLPAAAEAAVGDDLSKRARAVLSYVVGPALDYAVTDVADGKSVSQDPLTCLNCGLAAPSERSPYCSPACREVAGFVRQVRSGLAEGAIFQEERQIALGQVLWSLLGGGYPLRLSLVPPRSRMLVFKRTGDMCEVCGGSATTLDHIRTACNRPINLRPVCDACLQTRAFGDQMVLGETQTQELVSSLSERIASPVAIRCCDDHDCWDWRGYIGKRRALLSSTSNLNNSR